MGSVLRVAGPSLALWVRSAGSLRCDIAAQTVTHSRLPHARQTAARGVLCESSRDTLAARLGIPP